jgi:hypothetical protein
MVVCVHCGQENEEGSAYCLSPDCGQRLPGPVLPDPSESDSSGPDRAEPPSAPAPVASAPAPATSTGRRSAQRRAAHRRQGGRHAAKTVRAAAAAESGAKAGASTGTTRTETAASPQASEKPTTAPAGKTEPATASETRAAGTPGKTSASGTATGRVVLTGGSTTLTRSTPAAGGTATAVAPTTTATRPDPDEPAETRGLPARNLVLVGALVVGLLAAGSIVWMVQRPGDEAEPRRPGTLGVPAAAVTPSATPSAADPTPTAETSGTPTATASPRPSDGSTPSTSPPGRTPPQSTSSSSSGSGDSGGGNNGRSDTSSGGGSQETTFSGRYQIRPAHTGMCLGEGPELFKNTGRTVLGQHSCSSARPATHLEQVSGNIYRIKLHYSSQNIRCATVDYGGRGAGLLLAAGQCGSGRTDQQFRLEPVSSPASGYRLRSVAGGSSLCIGVYEGLTREGVQIIQETCRNGRHEVFTLQRV